MSSSKKYIYLASFVRNMLTVIWRLPENWESLSECYAETFMHGVWMRSPMAALQLYNAMRRGQYVLLDHLSEARATDLQVIASERADKQIDVVSMSCVQYPGGETWHVGQCTVDEDGADIRYTSVVPAAFLSRAAAKKKFDAAVASLKPVLPFMRFDADWMRQLTTGRDAARKRALEAEIEKKQQEEEASKRKLEKLLSAPSEKLSNEDFAKRMEVMRKGRAS